MDMMMNILDLTFQQREDVLIFPFNSETLLVPAPENLADLDQIIAVNDAGLIFWEELIAGKTPNEICRQWASRSGVELSELQNIALHLLAIFRPLLSDSAESLQV